jgi:nucleoside-triphosphatase THEP1
MNNVPVIPNNAAVYYRLIALWVLCEAMLGGIIHGFRIPVSGLIVGSSAVICICLIAWYVPVRGTIIKATIIVAIFKMMLSPQAPPPAYIAVFFQGLSGELLFRNRKSFRLSCILFATLALLESGLQRILVLTIIYGNDLWTAINDFLNKLTKQKVSTNYSLWIGAVYVAVHLITGLLLGWWVSLLPKRIGQWSEGKKVEIINTESQTVRMPGESKRKKRMKKGMIIVWLFLVALYVQSYFTIGKPLLPAHISLKILLRSLIIILAWIFIIGPLLKKLLHNWLEKKKSQSQQEVTEVLRLLPATQALLVQSWKRTAGRKRMSRFIRTVLVNALAPVRSSTFLILTGPIGSGKTTSLLNWAATRNDVYGILTPVINGKRVFMDAYTKEQFPMEADNKETEIIKVGRFVFSRKEFARAVKVIEQATDKPGWLIIDEIGPLELKGQGFCKVLKKALKKRDRQVILVVRKGLAEEVKSTFGIDATIIHDIRALEKEESSTRYTMGHEGHQE